MNYALYQLIVLLSAGASALLWLVRPTRPVMGFIAGGGWTIVTLQARNLEMLTESGTAIAIDGGQAWQLFALGMALVSIATVVLWYFGVYPPTVDDDAGEAGIPDERAQPDSTQTPTRIRS